MQNVQTSTVISSASSQLADTTGKFSQLLLPVSLQVNQQGAKLCFSQQQYLLNRLPLSTLQQLQSAQRLILNIVQTQAATRIASLIGLGQTYQLPLPTALLHMLGSSLDQIKRLEQLAARKEGYSLGKARVKNNILAFDAGSSISLPSTIIDGRYTAAIVLNNGQLQLSLSQIEIEQTVQLTQESHSLVEDACDVADETIPTSSSLNMAASYKNLFSQLAAVTLAHQSAYSPPEQTTQTDSNNQSHNRKVLYDSNSTMAPAITHQSLNNALIKAGGLPVTCRAPTPSHSDLAAELTKLLPSIRSDAITELAQPQKLKQTLIEMGKLAFAPSQWQQTTSQSHITTISLITQLLIAVNNKANISPELSKQLTALQDKLALPEPLLKLLQTAVKVDAFADILRNTSLYQQASDFSEQTTNFYFVIPYSINHYQEHLEGQISKQDTKASDNSTVWQLQLKFNLSAAALLINGQIQQTANQKPTLALSFSSDDPATTNKIKLLSASLRYKLIELGFENVKLESKTAAVAASILPGQHYLVKTKV
ncbi:hypothetical protein [Shewanella fidelis]|uniref:Flagellar hook-length control protein-like C-terminal domain-containing protein n=1 Tax=Shewanella fidelis TaxID=173509 RepID=A0AAW8NNZ1_9GAMM|nr:hypothetical protein [Shewanella fidelis]MDR8524442.1 hypothetical protein [Shewanella fidelis]MDW4811918.1 hypothetical protein [Shewanella fidelis]MDW4817143.1 hypothetical protein [Shewanella fidelis]MDW4821213.1 hypothetical protein [Shewanella fidelis]MDW4822524.1 hypothetical protein [Shewanella fidelis]